MSVFLRFSFYKNKEVPSALDCRRKLQRQNCQLARIANFQLVHLFCPNAALLFSPAGRPDVQESVGPLVAPTPLRPWPQMTLQVSWPLQPQGGQPTERLTVGSQLCWVVGPTGSGSTLDRREVTKVELRTRWGVENAVIHLGL